MRIFTSAFLVTALVSGCAYTTGTAPAQLMDGVLTGNNGMTLYTFDKDTQAGKSVCNGPCATNWPPFLATESDKPRGDFSIITRDDGKRQWALKGKPLYYWSKDTRPGDKTGEGVINAWHVARP